MPGHLGGGTFAPPRPTQGRGRCSLRRRRYRRRPAIAVASRPVAALGHSELEALGSCAMAAEPAKTGLISLVHIKRTAPPPPPRMAWPGGLIISNKDAAMVAFLAKRIRKGHTLTEQQLALLERFGGGR